MVQCPMAFEDCCSGCNQFGNCSPSKSLQKLNDLENELSVLKKMLQQLVDNK